MAADLKLVKIQLCSGVQIPNPALISCRRKEGVACSFSKISIFVMAVFLATSKQVKNLPRSKMSKVPKPIPQISTHKWQVWLPRMKDSSTPITTCCLITPPSHTNASNVHISGRFWCRLQSFLEMLSFYQWHLKAMMCQNLLHKCISEAETGS